LRSVGKVVTVSDPNAALLETSVNAFDLIIINNKTEGQDPLRLCSHFRTLERTRFLPILLATDAGDDRSVAQALELGVNDYICRPIDPNELIARSLTQIRRKRYNDRLREGVRQVMDLAIIDPLTGLNNRRYLDSHLRIVFDRARARQRPMSLCMIDIDRFKQINDTYGHRAGDTVLQQVSSCLRSAVRGADLLCRYGGEEFVIVMPDTDISVAATVSERLRATIANRGFAIDADGQKIEVTASFGIVGFDERFETPVDLVEAADSALYAAKAEGRNRVVQAAA
jgi:two-component system cell cycle response regulator